MTKTEQLCKENAELRAHVERLTGSLNLLVNTFMPSEGSGAGSRGTPDEIVAACVVLCETPTQSLREIQREAMEKMRKACFHAARGSCLLPPDGGQPTECEIAASDAAADAIVNMPLPLEDEQ